MLLNKSKCRQALLARAQQRWPNKMTSVQAAVYHYLNARLENEIQNFVAQHPTKGKTLMIATIKRKAKNGEMVSI